MTLTGFARCVPILVVALALNGAAAAPARSEEIKSNGATHDLKDIIAEGHLRVAFANFDVPGFRRKLPSGEFKGPEFELAKDIAKTLNLKLVIVNGGDTFNALAKTVSDLRADIGINRMSASFERAPYVRFSQPYAKLRHAMVYNRKIVARLAKGGNPEDSFRAFAGRVGVIGASSYVEFAKDNFPAATIVEVKSWDAGIQALRDQTIDGLYRDEFEVRRVLENNPDMGVPFGSAIFTDKVDFKVIYICNPCTNLQQLVNLYIESNQHLLARSMSIDALMRNARE
jgi:polar amino acid transport system substrate-binding protein